MIVYLDNSQSEKTYDFILPDGVEKSSIWMKFLYRPGHYDLVYE